MYFTQEIPEVVIGIERIENRHFDDAEVIRRLEPPVKISMIKIQYNREHVTGVKLLYKSMDGRTVKGTCSMKFKLLGGLFSGTKKEKYHIADGDYIKEIHGYVGKEINQLGFTTYKGVSHSCGLQKGVRFSHHFPLHTFTAARGSYDKFLDFIAFRVVPLTPQQIAKLGLNNNINIQVTQITQPPQYIDQYPQGGYPTPGGYPPPPPQGQYPPPPPPAGQYPQPGQYPPPPLDQYPPPGQYQPQQGQYQPPGQYPPPQQYPPQGQYPPQPQGQYPPPPQGQYQQPGQYPPGQYPPQGQYPQGQYPPGYYQPKNETIIITNQPPPPPPPQQSHGGSAVGALIGGALIGAALANNHHHHHHGHGHGPNVVIVEKHGRGRHHHH